MKIDTTKLDKKTIEILQSILQGSEYMEYLLPYVARHNVSIIAGLIEKNEIVMAKCIVESTPFSTVFPYLSRLDHRISCLFIYARIYRILHFILKFRRFLLSKM